MIHTTREPNRLICAFAEDVTKACRQYLPHRIKVCPPYLDENSEISRWCYDTYGRGKAGALRSHWAYWSFYTDRRWTIWGMTMHFRSAADAILHELRWRDEIVAKKLEWERKCR